MAEFLHSKVLFTEDGKPMHFYVAPSNCKRQIKPYIEAGGGFVDSKEKSDTIRLAIPGTKVMSDNCLPSKYIYDCVAQNKLLDMSQYRINRGDSCPEEVDSDMDVEKDSADDKIIIRGEATMKKGKKKYLLVEDMAILEYIINEKKYSDVKGKAMWTEMETLEITTHTWQSMKARFLKYILPHIGQYRVKPQDVAELAGILPSIIRKQIVEDVNPKFPESDTTSESETEVTGNHGAKSPTGRKKAQSPEGSEAAASMEDDDMDEDLLKCARKNLFPKIYLSPMEKRKKGPSDSSSNPQATSTKTPENPTSNKRRKRNKENIDSSELTSSPENKRSNHQNSSEADRESVSETEKVTSPKKSKRTRKESGAFKGTTLSARKLLNKLDEKLPQKRRSQRSSDNSQSDNSPSLIKTRTVLRSSTGSEADIFLAGPSDTTVNQQLDPDVLSDYEKLVMLTICQWLDVTHEQLCDALNKTCGNVDDAIHWILFDTTQSGALVWNEEDHNLLIKNTTKSWSTLLKKYNKEEINNRLHFLGILDTEEET